MALFAISTLACPYDLVDPSTAIDVTNSIDATTTGVRLNRVTNNFVGELQITNTSAGTLAAPLYAVLAFQNNFFLSNFDGVSCRAVPGAPFLRIDSSLAPGESVVLDVSYGNPDKAAIVFTLTVLSGTGTP